LIFATGEEILQERKRILTWTEPKVLNLTVEVSRESWYEWNGLERTDVLVRAMRLFDVARLTDEEAIHREYTKLTERRRVEVLNPIYSE